MATDLIKLEDLTHNPEEALSTSEMVQENLYVKPLIAEAFGVQTGVQMDKYIPILGQFGLSGKLDAGDCSSNTETDVMPVSQKQWTPKLISARKPFCATTVDQDFKAWKASRIAKGTWEDVNGELMTFVGDRLTDAIQEGIIRLAEFGDTAADNIADGGLLTTGVDPAFFTPFNGRWKQIYTDQAGTAKAYRYEIAENALGTYTAQNALASDAAYEIMKNLYDNIDPRAFASQNLKFQISRSLYNNWVAYIENKYGAYKPEILTDGTTIDKFRGVPIIVRKDWDRMIKEFFDNGTTLHLPHRAILGDINNMLIGTSDTESLNSFDSFYDKVTKKVYFDYAYKIDFKILQEELIAVAY